MNAPAATDHVLRRYTFKLYPTPAQERALYDQSIMMAKLWNALLWRQKDVYWRTRGQRGVVHDGKGYFSYQDMCREITALRAAFPEWAAISSTAARGVAQRIDLAFKAFFQRAKKGAGASSGYPRYRRTQDGMSICMTEASGSGWAITRRHDYAATDRNSGGWHVRIKGVAGTIKARGRLPTAPLDWRTGEFIHRDGCWRLSVVVRVAPRRAAGAEPIRIRFDLIDEFACVERANGGAPAASKEGITGQTQCDSVTPGRDTGNLSGNETLTPAVAAAPLGRDTGNLSGNETRVGYAPQAVEGRDTGNLSGNETRPFIQRLAARGRDTGNLSGNETNPCGHGRDTGRSLQRAADLCARADAIKSERDRRFVRKPFTRPSRRWQRETMRAANLTTKAARIRKHALHRWSYEIVAIASDLTVVMPAVAENTASPRGNKHEWGASVKTVSALNRNTLNQASAFAAQLLRYKAEEAGIRCDIIQDVAPNIAVGGEIVSVGKLARRAKRALKKAG